ncbi:antitoxin [Cumulibacter manganitolerans]|uniref:antitoxin n=1 Tax=Cumulibacter manganitolerans TaxID=1884992 RepID=UPI001297CB5F|nr:antitoxin [Cumulibacter manganitolerans]
MSKLDQILRKAQSFAQRNPDKVAKYAEKAGTFVNKRTQGKYAGQIDGALNRLDAFTGKPRRRPDNDGQAGGSW